MFTRQLDNLSMQYPAVCGQAGWLTQTLL